MRLILAIAVAVSALVATAHAHADGTRARARGPVSTGLHERVGGVRVLIHPGRSFGLRYGARGLQGLHSFGYRRFAPRTGTHLAPYGPAGSGILWPTFGVFESDRAAEQRRIDAQIERIGDLLRKSAPREFPDGVN